MSKFENKSRTDIIKIVKDQWPWIRKQLAIHGWSSNEIAVLANVSASTVRALMNGQNKRPSHEVMQKLLNLCIERYTGESEGKKPAAKKKSVKKKVAKKKAALKRPGWLK